MNSSHGRCLLLIASCVVVTAGCARHHVATSFGELAPRLKSGQTIYLTTTDGKVQKGRLETLSASHARLRIAGATAEVSERDTVRIAIPEPLWQGALIGGAAGAVTGSLGQQTAQAYDCFLGSERSCDSRTSVSGLLVGGLLGSALGTGIDALVWRRTTVFLTPHTTQIRVAVAPIARRGAAGLRVTARF